MIETAVYTDTGGREVNEDTALVLKRRSGVCALVADGLGGHGGGAIASRTVAEVFEQEWTGEMNPARLEEMLHMAHEAICSRQTPQCSMRSTAVALMVQERRCCWAHAGDSRLYHFEAGRLIFQTKDHSLSQTAVTLGQITPEQIRFHPDRSRIFRALGQDVPLLIDADEASLSRKMQAWLLCSDGFWEYVLEAEMQQDLQASENPREWLDKMVTRIRERVPADNDNCTAVAVWLKR